VPSGWDHSVAFRREGRIINFRRAPSGSHAAAGRKQSNRGQHRASGRLTARRSLAIALTLLWMLGLAVAAGDRLGPLRLGDDQDALASTATAGPVKPSGGRSLASASVSGARDSAGHSTPPKPAKGAWPKTLPSKAPEEPADGRQTSAPSVGRSQYLKTTRRTTLNRLGCAEGRRLARSKQESAIVVLTFGSPVRRHGHSGASLFRGRFASTKQIGRAAQAYGRGYLRCSEKLGPRLHMAIGTSNYGGDVTFRHGVDWAVMVNGTNDWARDQQIRGNLEFAGANDIELGWNGPGPSRAWVRGYDSHAEWPFYDFGDAAGCPPRGNCIGAWSPEDLWFVAWGARSAWPLPEIYTPTRSMAQEWYRLSLYSYKHHGMRMTLVGALSQRTACRQSSDPCRGMNNSPSKAWRQLYALLNGDPRTAQRLRWLSDFRWANP
jgi:hypothetical protein